MTTLLDLNDAALTRWRGNEAHLSPGYVRYDGDAYDFGEAARAAARRVPREVSTRFWSALDMQPLAPPLGPARHSADLIHSHLQQLLDERDSELILATPSHLSREQLSLLLGILETLPCQVVAIVNRSVAIAAASTTADCLHIEQQLRQTVLTPVVREGDYLRAAEPQLLPGIGALWLLEQLAGVVSAQFVEQTRFDPQRRAESEQALYDALPGMLLTLGSRPEARLEIDGYNARILPEHLQPIGERLRAEVNRGAETNAHWLLDSALLALPGLVRTEQASTTANDSWSAALLTHAAALRQTPENLRLVRSLPLQAATPTDFAPPPSAEPAPAAPPSHILIDGIARPVGKGSVLAPGIEIVARDGAVSVIGDAVHSLHVNGQTASAGQLLDTGDQLSDGGGLNVQLIRVED
jgi:hypothetical protein